MKSTAFSKATKRLAIFEIRIPLNGQKVIFVEVFTLYSVQQKFYY
ncbi:hypothetical protein T06_15552 [Trichinella sp. T6]|nr:hypothetical protein T06_15552 [Trichinella sp. T6]